MMFSFPPVDDSPSDYSSPCLYRDRPSLRSAFLLKKREIRTGCDIHWFLKSQFGHHFYPVMAVLITLGLPRLDFPNRELAQPIV
jgi:hypothetical protein